MSLNIQTLTGMDKSSYVQTKLYDKSQVFGTSTIFTQVDLKLCIIQGYPTQK